MKYFAFIIFATLLLNGCSIKENHDNRNNDLNDTHNHDSEIFYCYGIPKTTPYNPIPAIFIHIPFSKYKSYDSLSFTTVITCAFDTNNLDTIKIIERETDTISIYQGNICGYNKDGTIDNINFMFTTLSYVTDTSIFFDELTSKMRPIILKSRFYFDSLDRQIMKRHIDHYKKRGLIELELDIPLLNESAKVHNVIDSI